MDIIDRISYSKENYSIVNKYNLDWFEVLDDVGCFIWNVVCDPDKIEVLGKIGKFER
jgi:hypothetical protein